MNDAVRSMCSMDAINGRYLVQMPVMTCDGSLVSVSVWPEGNGVFVVSDAGAAYFHVANACASDAIFSRVAKEKCAEAGAQFDGASLLFIRIQQDRLKGAIISMASLIREVIDVTLERSFKHKHGHMQEELIRRACDAFPKAHRKEHATVIGNSTTEYEVDLLVDIGGRQLAFELFSKSGNAVNSAYTMLSDISRLEDGPAPIGVTPDRKAIGPKLTLITSVASVIELSASSEIYASLAA
ncbi:hypothetical protein SAMN05421772_101669 [Paracoccus saliphilus]|uniref:DUF1828 domain-containing protein n=1 Tax=Paracoccus saliphilus TaxID=405559 RepID=A0AA46A4C3_9RHOB|nr:hypothetical protein SAMN05421772_101669 [Paracoccus saliphilus]